MSTVNVEYYWACPLYSVYCDTILLRARAQDLCLVVLSLQEKILSSRDSNERFKTIMTLERIFYSGKFFVRILVISSTDYFCLR